MKAVVWIVVLFAAAVGIVLTSGVYTGNVYIVVGQVMMRVNLHAFVLGLVLFVVALYFLIKFIVGLMNIPTRMQRFGTARKGRQAAVALNSAGLAFFEGRFEKAEQEASKVLENKEAGDNRNLALMLGAHAADQMENFELRDHYLKDIEKLPNKQQLSRYLLLAESALGRRDYPTALENLNAAARIHPNLSRLARLQLRYAFDHGDAEDVLAKSEKLMKAGAINDFEAEQYQSWAYRRLLAEASDAARLKACLKRIPEALKADELCVAIAEKYERLGLYTEAVKWVRHYYPQNRRPELLEAFVESVRFFNERGQQKAIDLADSWLKDKPDDAPLLMYLGQLAYGRSLGARHKVTSKPASPCNRASPPASCSRRVLDETGQPQKAQEQRKLVLEAVSEEERHAALEQHS